MIKDTTNKIKLFLNFSARRCFFAFLLFLFAFPLALLPATAEDMVIKAGISLDKVPKELYGTWRVSSKLVSTNNEVLFKKNTVDLWNLSRAGNVITLDNPFSGAHASIMVNEVSNKLIKFQKVGPWNNSQKLTDVVELTLGKETFTGVNYLKLDTIDENGHVTESSKATYNLSGEKITGDSIK